jgi:hypothetical protein
MSQIDKLNYMPILFWFLVFFIGLYFILFVYILPLIFSGVKVRSLFFKQLIEEMVIISIFNVGLDLFYKDFSYFSVLNFLFSVLHSFIFLKIFYFRHGTSALLELVVFLDKSF